MLIVCYPFVFIYLPRNTDTTGVPFVGIEGVSTLKDGDYTCVLYVIRVVSEQRL